jgi:hypothetical protein
MRFPKDSINVINPLHLAFAPIAENGAEVFRSASVGFRLVKFID